jgi:uncharacterized protein
LSNSDVIRYDLIVQEAMLGVVKKVLTDTQKNGLKNDHHFYLTYSTCFEGVEIPSSLLEKYPDEITIVLQHEFEDLIVKEDHFVVTLWFNNVPAHLRVPFKAIKAFFDPSVKFGLQFNIINEEKNDALEEDNVADITATFKNSKDAHKDGDDSVNQKTEAGNNNIVSLDSFRKK